MLCVSEYAIPRSPELPVFNKSQTLGIRYQQSTSLVEAPLDTGTRIIRPGAEDVGYLFGRFHNDR
jgi:hypothetical protein